MAENRVMVDPSVLNRLAQYMNDVAEAWRRDVDALNEANARTELVTREYHSTSDRADNLQSDLRAATERVHALIERIASPEAKYQALHAPTPDARDVLATIANRVAKRAEETPPVQHQAVRADGTTTPRTVPAPATISGSTD